MSGSGLRGSKGNDPQQKDDIEFEMLPELSWAPEHRIASLDKVAAYAANQAESAIKWYLTKKKSKQWWARGLRLAAIVLVAVAGALPLIADLTEGAWLSSSWSAVVLIAAGTAIALDRFFGFSTAWMRYVATEMAIRQVLHDFLFDWEIRRSTWQKTEPDLQKATDALTAAKAFVAQINTMVKTETDDWVREFTSALAEIDRTARAQVEAARSGSLHLSVAGGADADDGWLVSIDGAAHVKRTGPGAVFDHLTPRRHTIAVKASVGGIEKTAQADFTITPGQATNLSLELADPQ